MTDYLAGCFNGFMRGFPTSREIFKNIIYPLLRRKDKYHDSLGWGIIEIPRDDKLREELRKKLNRILE